MFEPKESGQNERLATNNVLSQETVNFIVNFSFVRNPFAM